MAIKDNNGHARIFCVEDIARICHEANRALCRSQGDRSQLPWTEAPNWQRESACDGVRFHLANPQADAQASHANWMAYKQAEGWRYGHHKDPEQKLHPCMLPFEDLPPEQQAKDHVFRAIVRALAPFIAGRRTP